MWSRIGAITTINYWYPPFEYIAFAFLHLPTTIKLISGWSIVLFPWIAINILVNTISGMPTTVVVVVGNVELWLGFLPIETPPNLLPNYFANLTGIPLLITSMLGTRTISTPMVVIFALSDWITPIPTYCLWVSTIVVYDTIGGTMLTRNWHCSNLWLPIGILCCAICGCEYPSGSIFLVQIDGWICWIYGPNWLPNSMLLNIFWTTWIPYSCSCGWSINVPTTFCNSTCLVIFALMWKGTKR